MPRRPTGLETGRLPQTPSSQRLPSLSGTDPGTDPGTGGGSGGDSKNLALAQGLARRGVNAEGFESQANVNANVAQQYDRRYE